MAKMTVYHGGYMAVEQPQINMPYSCKTAVYTSSQTGKFLKAADQNYISVRVS